MGRPRTPTQVLELKGAFKKDPQRRRTEPEPAGPLGEAPESFCFAAGISPEQAIARKELTAIWHELSGMCPARVLTVADRWLVELACRTMLGVRRGSALASERNLLLSCLSRMGLTPADRSKIAVPEKEAELDEIAQLAAESRAVRPN